MAYVALAAVIIVLGVLLAAPRLAVFEDRRWRAALIGVAFVVLPVALLVSDRVVRARATDQSKSTAHEMFAALDSASLEDLRADMLGIGPTVIPFPHKLAEENGGITALAPVRYAWAGWCVVGHKDTTGRVEVDRRRGTCP